MSPARRPALGPLATSAPKLLLRGPRPHRGARSACARQTFIHASGEVPHRLTRRCVRPHAPQCIDRHPGSCLRLLRDSRLLDGCPGPARSLEAIGNQEARAGAMALPKPAGSRRRIVPSTPRLEGHACACGLRGADATCQNISRDVGWARDPREEECRCESAFTYMCKVKSQQL